MFASFIVGTLILAVPVFSSHNNRSLNFFIGTYTSNPGSKGIYSARLDPKTGQITTPELAAVAPDPSFVAVAPGGRFLYAALESTAGQYSAFAVKPDLTLEFLNTQTVEGAGPCHVSVDPEGRYLFTASYGDGTFGCLPIRSDGSLGPPTAQNQNSGSGPDKSRQAGPHGHCALLDHARKRVYACDLGADQVLVYQFDAARGSMTPDMDATAKVKGGAGPRHIALHPNGKFAYVNNEMGNSVTAFAIDAATGGLRPIQTISTRIANGRPRPNTTAEIVCHPNGKFLYVSNRGDDTIAVFRISPAGTLALVSIEPSGVREPRGFDIDAGGKWMVVAGQNSCDLTSQAIDPATGKLNPTGSRVSIDHPVCIAFIKP